MVARVIGRCPYLPLPMDGNAMDFSFLSSARAKQFFTVFSSSSSHLSAPQTGLLQWITNLAGRPCPALTAAERDETGTVSLFFGKEHSTRCQTQTHSPATALLPAELGFPHKHGLETAPQLVLLLWEAKPRPSLEKLVLAASPQEF